MKKIIFASLCSCISLLSFSQENKPSDGSFGIQYGVSYSGTLNQSLYLSGMIKKGWELRGGMLLSYSSSHTKTSDTTLVASSNGIREEGTTYQESKSATLTVTPNIAVIKHFKTTSNVDPYAGAQIAAGVSLPTIPSQNINGLTSADYSTEENRMTKIH